MHPRAVALGASLLAAIVTLGHALPPMLLTSPAGTRVLRLRGHGPMPRERGARPYVYGTARTPRAPAAVPPPLASKDAPAPDAAEAPRWRDPPGDPCGKTRLTAAVTPRAAQRARELAASPGQLSPASPVTEDDDGEPSAAVLQRVNDAASAVRWDHADRTPAPPPPGERVTQRMEPTTACRQARALAGRAPDGWTSDCGGSIRRLECTPTPECRAARTLAADRQAIFNTPLPPGARAALRRNPQQVLYICMYVYIYIYIYIYTIMWVCVCVSISIHIYI